jgi:hypothetical protein
MKLKSIKSVKESLYTSLYTIWFHLCDILEKVTKDKLVGRWTNQNKIYSIILNFIVKDKITKKIQSSKYFFTKKNFLYVNNKRNETNYRDDKNWLSTVGSLHLWFHIKEQSQLHIENIQKKCQYWTWTDFFLTLFSKQ